MSQLMVNQVEEDTLDLFVVALLLSSTDRPIVGGNFLWAFSAPVQCVPRGRVF